MEKKNFALKKRNLYWIAAGFIVILLGFLLMMGSKTVLEFNPDIFSVRRIRIAPMVSLLGFIIVGVGILKK